MEEDEYVSIIKIQDVHDISTCLINFIYRIHTQVTEKKSNRIALILSAVSFFVQIRYSKTQLIE